ncbi:MAG: VTT domain-containing protein, partial [Clostridium sp.]|uniref:TVP38/TMEM64 family protein n=1 Tax=Clostridium sp. TaxID=1506 RepID=UPI00305C5C92
MNVENFINILSNYGNMAVFISLFANVIIGIVGVLPSIFVTGANIIFFGTVNGFFISLMGETIGAVVAFSLYRKGFKRRAEKFSINNRYLKRLVQSEGVESCYLVGLTRLLPFIPSGFVTIGASISNINIIYFTIATFVGKIPSITLEALVSYDFINIQDNWIRLVITLISLILIISFINNKYKNNE